MTVGLIRPSSPPPLCFAKLAPRFQACRHRLWIASAEIPAPSPPPSRPPSPSLRPQAQSPSFSSASSSPSPFFRSFPPTLAPPAAAPTMEAKPSAADLKDQGNVQFKAQNFLKAAALYTQAIKLDPDNAALYSNRSAAFLNLVKLTKALADAEMAIKLKPTWEKGFFRKGCCLEAMERYEEALATYREALTQNPQSSEVATKVKRLAQVVREKKRNLQDKPPSKANGSSAVSEAEPLRIDAVLDKALPPGTSDETRKFAKESIETALKDWNDNNLNVDANVRLCLGKDASKETLPNVAVEKAFESPDTLNSCAAFLRQYIVDSSSTAACLIVAKKSIAFPQVWKGTGTRKWIHGNSNGFFIQLETSAIRRLWFVPSTVEHGRNVFRTLEPLDIDLHAVLPPLFR